MHATGLVVLTALALAAAAGAAAAVVLSAAPAAVWGNPAAPAAGGSCGGGRHWPTSRPGAPPAGPEYELHRRGDPAVPAPLLSSATEYPLP